MKIDKITRQYRRDFRAIMKCEHCGHIEKDVSGYDDAYFHNNVIPDMKCKKCDKKGSEDYRPLTPKYGANQIV